MMTRTGLAGCVLVAAVLVVGCARKNGADAQDVAPETIDSIVQIQNRLVALEAESGVAGLLRGGTVELVLLEDPSQQYALFSWLTQRAMETGDPEAILFYIQGLVDENLPHAGEAVHALDAMLMQMAPEIWIAFLQAADMPPGFRAYGSGLWFGHFADEASVAALIPQFLLLQDPVLQGYTETLFRDAMGQVLRHVDADRIWAVLEGLREQIPQESHVRNAFLHAEGQALVRDGKLAEAFAHYEVNAEQLGEALVSGVIGTLLPLAAEAGDQALVSTVRAWGYAADGFPMLRNRLARWDLHQLRSEADVLLVVAGVQDVLAKGIPVQVVSSGFIGNLFYAALPRAERDALLAIRDLLLQMDVAASEAPASVQGAIGTAILDVNFYLEDFRGALARVEKGVPGFDAEWHTELHDKVQAHLAQQEGRTADAVAFYAAHIARVRNWEDPVVSPEDGRRVMPAEVIALNERRIGALWEADGEKEKAAAAYARAITHYQAAYTEYSEDDASRALMREALDALGVVAP